jgi:hypothetical protein
MIPKKILTLNAMKTVNYILFAHRAKEDLALDAMKTVDYILFAHRTKEDFSSWYDEDGWLHPFRSSCHNGV